MTNKLNQLFEICGKNHFEFTYQKEGDKNFITHSINPNIILVNIIDVDDVNLDSLLSDKIEELKKMFQ